MSANGSLVSINWVITSKTHTEIDQEINQVETS